MTTYNRTWLKQRIASKLHDDSVSAELDTWIDVGAKRVSEILRCDAMRVQITRNAGDLLEYLELLPGDKRLLQVEYLSNGGQWLTLNSLPDNWDEGFGTQGSPQAYQRVGRFIFTVPAGDWSMRCDVIREVVIPDDDSEIDVLTEFPFLFLNAAMAEAYDWKEDEELMLRNEQKWVNEAGTITSNWEAERVGTAPAMRAR